MAAQNNDDYFREMMHRFERHAVSSTGRSLHQSEVVYDAGSNRVVHSQYKEMYHSRSTAGADCREGNDTGYVHTTRFTSSTCGNTREFRQDNSNFDLPKPATNPVYFGPNANEGVKPCQMPNPILGRESSQQSQSNRTEIFDSRQTRDTGAVPKKVKFSKVSNQREIYTDPSHRDSRSESSQNSSPICCFRDPKLEMALLEIRSKLINPLQSKFQELCITETHQDILVTDFIQRAQQAAKNLRNVMQYRLSGPALCYAISTDVTSPAKNKVQCIFRNTHSQILSLFEDLDNLPQNITKVCKHFGCSNEAITATVNLIGTNFKEEMKSRLEDMDSKNFYDERLVTEGLHRLPKAILARHSGEIIGSAARLYD